MTQAELVRQLSVIYGVAAVVIVVIALVMT
jgi:hypothetical protein